MYIDNNSLNKKRCNRKITVNSRTETMKYTGINMKNSTCKTKFKKMHEYGVLGSRSYTHPTSDLPDTAPHTLKVPFKHRVRT